MPRPRDPNKRRIASRRFTVGYAELRGDTWFTRIGGRRQTTQLRDVPGNEQRVRKILDERVEAYLFGAPERPVASAIREARTVADAIEAFTATKVPQLTGNVATLFSRTFAFYFPEDCALEYDELLRVIVERNATATLNVATTAKYLAHARRFFAWCIERKWLDRNPVSAVGIPRVPRKLGVTIYTPAEVVRLAAYFARQGRDVRPCNSAKAERSGRLYCLLIMWLYSTGCRIGETLALRWDQVTDDAVVIHGKGQRLRLFPLAPFPEVRLILDELRAIRGSEEYLWPWRHPETPQRVVREGKKAAGMPTNDGRSLHTFRASCEWRWRERLGLPVELISDLAGHSVAVQVGHYRKTRDARELADAVERVTVANQWAKLGAREAAKRGEDRPTPDARNGELSAFSAILGPEEA